MLLLLSIFCYVEAIYSIVTLAGSVKLRNYFFKVWWQDATLFVYFSYFITYLHSITFIQYIYPSPFAEASLHFFIACMLGKHLPVVPSRESNSGLPYSKPTRYQLSHAAPYWATLHHKLEIINNVDWDADPGSLSQVPVPVFFSIRIPDQGFWIQNPGCNKNKKRREKIN